MWRISLGLVHPRKSHTTHIFKSDASIFYLSTLCYESGFKRMVKILNNIFFTVTFIFLHLKYSETKSMCLTHWHCLLVFSSNFKNNTYSIKHPLLAVDLNSSTSIYALEDIRTTGVALAMPRGLNFLLLHIYAISVILKSNSLISAHNATLQYLSRLSIQSSPIKSLKRKKLVLLLNA